MKKFYFYVLGCAMNYSDAERLTAVLSEAGYVPGNESEADIILVIACSVRQKAVDKIYGKTKQWQRLRRKNPALKLVLSGCVLPEDKQKLSKSFDLFFDSRKSQRLKDFLVENSNIETLNKNLKLEINNYEKDYFKILPKYSSAFRAYVPIMTGCDNFCSYCAVPYTRGREISRPKGEILSEVRRLIKGGYKEITLLGQNVNSYGTKKKSENKNSKNQFVELLKEIDKIPGDYRVYFYSNHPKDFSDELIEIMPQLEHFPPYIHLPLQSGDDEILRKMNRHYTAEQYLHLVKKIRKNIPGVTLTTDIIVGFPGEGEEEFQNTIKVIKKSKFDMIFIGQYSPRPGTPSAKMKETVSSIEKKEREKTITKILAERLLKENLKLVGKKLTVLVDEKKDSTFFGRTDNYRVVEIEGADQILEIGLFYNVEITKADVWKLLGTVVIPD